MRPFKSICEHAFTLLTSTLRPLHPQPQHHEKRVFHATYYSYGRAVLAGRILLGSLSSLFKTPISTWGKSKVKGGRPARGRVPGRTCRRSNYCGFAEVLGLFRAELYRMNIGLGELKMTAWSFRTSLTKWDPLTRPGW